MATELFAAIKGGDQAAVERLLERDRALADSAVAIRSGSPRRMSLNQARRSKKEISLQ